MAHHFAIMWTMLIQILSLFFGTTKERLESWQSWCR